MINTDDLLQEYPFPTELNNLVSQIDAIKSDSEQYHNNIEALQTMFNSIDLTTLNATDSAESVRAFVEKVNTFARDYPDLKNIGGICVYSVFAPIMKSALRADGVHRAVVAACFPSSQAFTDIKCAEVRRSIEGGATEVDVVISVGEMIEHNYQFVYEELKAIREAAEGARLKVILETGALRSAELIWEASIVAMAAGADFIKTSTGKGYDGATPEAAIVMCSAIKSYASKQNRKVGFKPSGGVSTVAEAALYYNIVKTILGEEWLVNTLFRIGASRLANNLLVQILTIAGRPVVEKFF